VLFTPEAYEAFADEPWSAERVRAAIASIVADAENAFDTALYLADCIDGGGQLPLP